MDVISYCLHILTNPVQFLMNFINSNHMLGGFLNDAYGTKSDYNCE